MADLKGAVKMTIDYSDGTQTVVHYNPISGEQVETPASVETPSIEPEAIEVPVAIEPTPEEVQG